MFPWKSFTSHPEVFEKRDNVREIFGESFSHLRPRMNYFDYERACLRLGKEPNEDEWLKLFEAQEGDGPGAA